VTSGLLDTSVVVDWHDPIVVAALPDQMAISAITAAELAAGHANGLDLYTRNSDDFAGLEDLVHVIAI